MRCSITCPSPHFPLLHPALQLLDRKARQKARASGSLSAFAYEYTRPASTPGSAFAYEALPERRTRGVRVSYDVDAYFAKQLG